MLLRETHCAIKKVSEFVQNRAGLENVNPLLCVCRRADAIHAELAAESCESAAEEFSGECDQQRRL